MIRTESELRVALHAVLVTVLAFYGFWGCAVVALAILVPWKPILAAAAYLAQPVMGWLAGSIQRRHQNRVKQVERDRQAQIATATRAASLPAVSRDDEDDAWKDFSPSQLFRPRGVKRPVADLPSEPKPKANQADTLAVLPYIVEHLRNSSHEALTNMSLEVEQVKFDGETADACVRFQSPNVTELVIRERYLLRKSGDRWHVQPRQTVGPSAKRPRILSAGQRPS